MIRYILMGSLFGAFILLSACSSSNNDNKEPTAAPSATTGEPAMTEEPSQPGDASALPQDDEPYELEAANFVAEIDNPYWPMTPGNTWVYNETDAEGTVLQVEVVVTSDTKTIQGIEATVVHDTVTEDGEVVEDTFDWYAQDADGNIWYLGEDTKEYEGGEVTSTAGSWEHGVDGALAGILIPGTPEVGQTYRQEYYAGEAEDSGKILSLTESVEVPFGSFEGCLQTEDTTALEPDVLEHKYYCQGVGPALAIDVAGGGGREELVTFEQAS